MRDAYVSTIGTHIEDYSFRDLDKNIDENDEMVLVWEI